jgi:predicted Rossmann fold nucleotide-binding protein DprA/Smf involved in DNA uptake
LPEEASLRIIKETEESNSEDAALTDTEKNVVSLLSFEQPKHVDQISIQTGLKSQELLGALVSLELKSYITQMPGKHFLRVK